MKTPQLPPLIIKKSPSAFYVYTYKNKWDPEKKRSYRASFKKVGTVTSGEKEGRIRWDDHFLAERPELRDFICERKGKDYVFTPMNEGGFTLSQAMEVKQLHAGATWALDQLVVQSPIGEALKTAFPLRTSSSLIKTTIFLGIRPLPKQPVCRGERLCIHLQ